MKDRIKKPGGELEHGEAVGGDRVGGDKISVGNILHSDGIAIGRGAQVRIQSVTDLKELAELFSPIYQQIEVRPIDPLVEKDELTDHVKRIEKEIAMGDQAQPAKVERWLRNLAGMAPDIVEVTLAALTGPAAGIYMAIRKTAQKLWEEMH